MVLAFKSKFVDKIKSGSKIHTIRSDNKNRWQPGLMIHFATGVRTRMYHEFAKGVCIAIQDFEIKYDYEDRKTTAHVFVENELFGQVVWFDCCLKASSFSVDMLAANDGFSKVDDFFEWFDTDFKGKLIHWRLD